MLRRGTGVRPFSNSADDTHRRYLSGFDFVVLGTIVSGMAGIVHEAGVIRFFV